jgi:isopentenyl diphosphate isomerase/L-lactate dehydrogenase-like FMN-dependent dehydrogenase
MPNRLLGFKTLMKKTSKNLTGKTYRTSRKLILINFTFIHRLLLNEFMRNTEEFEKALETFFCIVN